jgi:dTDP-6-deoxy-L-talose 4-dehydrogenase (NAD+)
MTPQHVVVTGAAGYIGRHTVTALLDRGARVTAIVRPRSRRQVDARAVVVEADVLAPEFDFLSLTGSVDSLIHLAWQDGFRHNAPSHIEMLSSHFRFLHAAALAGTRRIAALGTMHEIGYWEGAIDADTPTNPTSLYGIAKDALRRSLFQAVGDDVTLQWLRSYYIYGDDRNNQSIFTRLLEAADDGKSSFPFTSGKNLFDFIEIDELARQIATVALQDEVRGVINLCSGTPVSLGDKVEEFIASRHLGLSLDYGAFPDREYDSPGVWGDASAIRALMDRSHH